MTRVSHVTVPDLFPVKQYNLYEELLFGIKSLLTSSRKGDPLCCVAMGFDTIHFDGLVRRGVLNKKLKQNVYTLTRLDDILGSQWYIRGDFCYVQPKTVKYYLKFCAGKPDYQLLDDSTLLQCSYSIRHELIFRFVHGDGISSQWHNVINL